MLPFIFSMTPVEAFSFLLGMTAVTATTGDITSILFGVPGEPITASILVDGHPMAKKGEAGRALGAALMSSFVGAIFGALCLAICYPGREAAGPVRRLAPVLHARHARHRVPGFADRRIRDEGARRGMPRAAVCPGGARPDFRHRTIYLRDALSLGRNSAWCRRRWACSRSRRSSTWRLPGRASPSRMSGKSAVSSKGSRIPSAIGRWSCAAALSAPTSASFPAWAAPYRSGSPMPMPFKAPATRIASAKARSRASWRRARRTIPPWAAPWSRPSPLAFPAA